MALSEREQRVCDLIRKRESALLEDLRLHVGLPTGGGNVDALSETRERFATRAAALGAGTALAVCTPRPAWLYGETAGKAVPPTLVCDRECILERREILIAGHLDTVHDPRGGFRELTISSDGRTATGPGCVDMKGGLVVAMAALEALHEVEHALAWTLVLNSDEETGSYGSAKTIREVATRVAKRGGLGIALEPAAAEGGLVVERAGSAQFMIEVRGRASHVGRDFASGVSAVTELAALVLAITKMGRPENGLIVNIGPLQGNEATNVVPDLARAWGNVRFTTPADAEAFETRLKGLEGVRDSGASVTARMNIGRPAKPLTPEVEGFARMCVDAAGDLGQPLPLAKTGGVCDGNLMQAAGLPTLDTLGVRGGRLHTPQEWIDLSSLVERCQLLAVVLMRASVDR